MIFKVFAVHDMAVKAFLPPFFARAAGEALRSFAVAVNDAEHQFHKHSADYVLFCIGEFDDSNGLLHGSEPQRISSALECLADRPVLPPRGPATN